MSAAGAGILGGAIGGGLAVTVLAPLTAANNFLGSYFFGSGMILGERQMYQDDWIKIKKRLDAGESFLVILEEVMKPNTQAVMQMARETVIAVSAEWNKIVLDYLSSIPQSILDAINRINGGEAAANPWPLGEGVIGVINGVVQCHADYNKVGNACIKKDATIPTPFEPVHVHAPGEHGHKTFKEILDEKDEVDKEIVKVHTDPLMVQYTKFLNKIVFLNKTIRALVDSYARASKPKPGHILGSIKNFTKQKEDTLKFFATWKRNNARWLSANNLS